MSNDKSDFVHMSCGKRHEPGKCPESPAPTEQEDELRKKMLLALAPMWVKHGQANVNSGIIINTLLPLIRSQPQVRSSDIERVKLEARIDEVTNQMENYSYIPEDAGGQVNRQLRIRHLQQELAQLTTHQSSDKSSSLTLDEQMRRLDLNIKPPNVR